MQELNKDILLIVDSNAITIKLYKLIFRDAYELMIAKDSDEALQLLKDNEVKVVLADCLQTSDSVVNLFETMIHEGLHAQRIITVNQSDHVLIMDAINRGKIFSYVTKPIDNKSLLVVVRNAFEQYELQKSNHELVYTLKANNIELKALLKDLEREEAKFRNIFNASPDPIFIIDANTVILESNQYAQDQFSYSNEALINIPLTAFIHEADVQKALEYVIQLKEVGNTMCEIRMITNKNTKCDFEINGYPLIYQGAKAIMITLRDLSERKEMEKKVLHSVIQTEEKERRRFAQELHDGIGPLLSTTKLYLQWFNKPNLKMDKNVIIAKMEETLEETINSLREISNNISPNTLMSFGLNTALKTFVNRIRNVSDITIRYTDNLTLKLKPELEVTAYRLICECLNNSLKHSEASVIELSVFNEEDVFYINYQDNGVGFEPESVMAKANGTGLLNMKTRVQSMGGQIDVQSSQGHGTVITVKVEMK